MNISQLDHMVMTVRDIEQTCHFYSEVLGLEVVSYGDNRKAIFLGNQKIKLHEFGKEYKPHAKYPSPGSADLCFLTDMQMQYVVEQLAEKKVKIVDGPVQRIGTHGHILSVYIKDPDGNLIEIANQMSISTRDQKHAT